MHKGKAGKWEKRWVTLKNRFLLWKSDPESKKPWKVNSLDGAAIKTLKSSTKPLSVEISGFHPNGKIRKWDLGFDTHEQMEVWCRLIAAAATDTPLHDLNWQVQGILTVEVIEAKGLDAKDRGGTSGNCVVLFLEMKIV
jgi:hypothetical protein